MDSPASLHKMSKNVCTSDERRNIRTSKEPTVIMAADGKVESTEEATVHVNNLDVFCHNDAVGRFTSSAIFGKSMRRNEEILRIERGRVSMQFLMNLV